MKHFTLILILFVTLFAPYAIGDSSFLVDKIIAANQNVKNYRSELVFFKHKTPTLTIETHPFTLIAQQSDKMLIIYEEVKEEKATDPKNIMQAMVFLSNDLFLLLNQSGMVTKKNVHKNMNFENYFYIRNALDLDARIAFLRANKNPTIFDENYDNGKYHRLTFVNVKSDPTNFKYPDVTFYVNPKTFLITKVMFYNAKSNTQFVMQHIKCHNKISAPKISVFVNNKNADVQLPHSFSQSQTIIELLGKCN